ncbi:MAG: phosphotransferase [Solirubrobacteraceae bacterium]
MSGTDLDRRLPQSVEEFDDAWISGVLGAEVRITGTEGVGVGAAFACQLFRLTLDGAGEGPASVIVKVPVVGEVRVMLDAIGAYGREVIFYRDLAGQLPVRTPHIHLAAQAQDTTDFVIVMEDLVDCAAVDQIAGMSLSQAEAAVDALARFHGWSWGREEFLAGYADRFWPVDSEAGAALQGQYGQLFAHVWGMRRDALGKLLSPKAQGVGDRYAELQPELVRELSGPRCLTHGELRADNLFFDGGGQPVLFDFQAAQQECGVRELQYLLGTSVPEDLLGAYDEQLLARYVDGLRAQGLEYSFDEAASQYAAAATYNLLWPVMANLRWEAASERGRETLDTMVRRLGAAIDRTSTT